VARRLFDRTLIVVLSAIFVPLVLWVAWLIIVGTIFFVGLALGDSSHAGLLLGLAGRIVAGRQGDEIRSAWIERRQTRSLTPF